MLWKVISDVAEWTANGENVLRPRLNFLIHENIVYFMYYEVLYYFKTDWWIMTPNQRDNTAVPKYLYRMKVIHLMVDGV